MPKTKESGMTGADAATGATPKNDIKAKARDPDDDPEKKVDPVTFFTKTHDQTKLLDKIFNLVGVQVVPERKKEFYPSQVENLKTKHMTTDEFDAHVAGLMKMRLEDDFEYCGRNKGKAMEEVGEETVNRCVKLLALASEAMKPGVERPAAFAVNQAWREFMMGRAARGMEEFFAFRSKLDVAREEVLGGEKPVLDQFPTPCTPCGKVFLRLVGSENERLFEWFREEKNFCGLHSPKEHRELQLGMLKELVKMEQSGFLAELASVLQDISSDEEEGEAVGYDSPSSYYSSDDEIVGFYTDDVERMYANQVPDWGCLPGGNGFRF